LEKNVVGSRSGSIVALKIRLKRLEVDIIHRSIARRTTKIDKSWPRVRWLCTDQASFAALNIALGTGATGASKKFANGARVRTL